MKIALASPPFPKSIADALYWVEKLTVDAATQQAAIICFPESYIPGYPAIEYEVPKVSPAELQQALDKVCQIAAQNNIAIIMAMDWYDGDDFLNVAYVISKTGERLGYQSKNQLDPTEDNIWVPGTKRQLFEVDGLKFGITICHEGFRYPESVRWAARKGAHIVFHPHLAGSDVQGRLPTEWGSMDNPYYERAMIMRANENTIYFASVNYAMKYPESATSLISPDGKCIAYQPYGEPGVLVFDIDLEKATGYLAKRFKPELYN
ncbi:carbon-nitrogen hydrolase family protein [Mucilaginibacter boryungensis]|uniref:Carbon-nitrogen hydrolase family protein n=1 Tax=Mucilaginibacter boryungensis TaxID=768480 RepID=A0ABR9XN84_9SPHI|nr:carbon-nitrogen hydrolase family protein [Mucilaginibacter boryungensis]MBE9668826.1 carbon-nitrogen hydrolase family protein [Mucilaginibacter boryungensis]